MVKFKSGPSKPKLIPAVMSISAAASKVVFPSWSIQTVPNPPVWENTIVGIISPPINWQLTLAKSKLISNSQGAQGSVMLSVSSQPPAPLSKIVMTVLAPAVTVKV